MSASASIPTVKTFAGGIANSGSLTSRNGKGINLPGVQTFSGGIDNQSGGTISAALSGIFISGTSFAGGVTNAGLITGGAGIVVSRLGGFSSVGGGGIANSGSISVGGVGVGIASVSTFDGNITNGGTDQLRQDRHWRHRQYDRRLHRRQWHTVGDPRWHCDRQHQQDQLGGATRHQDQPARPLPAASAMPAWC